MLNTLNRWWVLGLALTTSACLVAVDADRDQPYSQDPGVITVAWLVRGSSRHSACEDFGAQYAHIDVRDADGHEHTQTVPCDDFSVDFDLPRDEYEVSVTLQDGSHHDLTSNVLDASGVALVVFDLPAQAR